MSDSVIWVALAAALLSCYFTAANYALLDFSRSRLLELLRRRGARTDADDLAEWRTGLLLVTALLRTSLNLVILLAMVDLFAAPQPAAATWWPNLGLALLVTAALIAVFGVAVPLSWSRYAAEPLLAHTMPLLRALHAVSRPFLVALHWFDPLVRRLLGVPKPLHNDAGPLEQEILDAVSEGEKSGLVDESQREMIAAVVEFPSITVAQIMTPRTDVEGVEVSSSLEDVKRFVTEAGHSRIPVYEGDLDHILGILYVKDLIPLLGTNGERPFDLRAIVREAVFVPEAKPLRDLLTQFKASKIHMALVLDEYGGTAGLVTIEDILEEIVGEIHDEYEPPEEEPAIEQVGERVFDVHARVRIDEVNDRLRLALPEDEDYDTVGGFVFAALGRIPETGESFEHTNARITVTEAEKTRIKHVRVELLDAQTAHAAESNGGV